METACQAMSIKTMLKHHNKLKQMIDTHKDYGTTVYGCNWYSHWCRNITHLYKDITYYKKLLQDNKDYAIKTYGTNLSNRLIECLDYFKCMETKFLLTNS